METMMDIKALEDQFTSGIYAKRDLVITRGSGALLYDEQGNEYIDCVGGQGTANVGHCQPTVIAAIQEQIQNLMICPEMFHNPTRAQFQARLCGLVPGMQRAYLCNSGTEAVEAAIKFARFSTGRPGIVAAMRGFHGRTLGSLSATWNKKYRDGFEPLVPGFSHVPYDNLEKLQEAVNDSTAAVLLEVVQGEGGVYPGSAEFLQGAQEVCRQRGALLIIDEVQTGFGRTGQMFAFQHHGLQPDLLAMGKSIAAGIPMGAVLLGERVAQLNPGLHGSTFGGNPVACAAGLAVLDLLEGQQLPQRAARLGKALMDEIAALNLPAVREVRGKGLMIGIETRGKVAGLLGALAEKGVLALPAGLTVIRLLPPLVISEEQLQTVKQALIEVLSA